MTFITYKPCANTREGGECDMPRCNSIAVVDARLEYSGQWGYFCIEHFMSYCSKDPQLVNNITSKDISITI